LITLLIAVIIFSTAAICNQCSATSSTTTEKVGVESTAATGTTTAQTISETTTNAAETTVASTSTENETAFTQEQQQVIYANTQYSFSFLLPLSWEGYQIIESKWEGYTPEQQGDVTVEKGPIISIRHPKWTSANPRQDIPIMVFTLAQWDSLQQDKFHIGAAPIGPSELGNNTKYVFALPARYNFSFPTGYEEVEKILEGNPLKAF
jgi:hypothetical protein